MVLFSDISGNRHASCHVVTTRVNPIIANEGLWHIASKNKRAGFDFHPMGDLSSFDTWYKRLLLMNTWADFEFHLVKGTPTRV